MSKKDVENYYKDVQYEYLQMLSTSKELDYLFKTNQISSNRYDETCDYIKKLKDNYERLAYIMMLLNRPNKKDKKIKEQHQNEKLYNYLKNSDEQVVHTENEDVLKHLRQIIKESKKDDKTNM